MNQENQQQQPEKLAEWTNFGDYNPEIHGGRFVKWEGDYWRLIQTRNLAEDGPEGMIQDGEIHMFEEFYIYPDDVWPDGNPENGLSKPIKDILESFGKQFLGILEHEEFPPDIKVEYFIVDLPFYTGMHGRDTYHENYWETLENFGVDVELENGWEYSG